MGLVVDTSLTAVCVTRELDYIVEVRGCPRMIVSDNGTGTSNTTILAWQDELGIEWHYTSHPASRCRMGLSKAPCIDGPADARNFNSVLKIGRVCSCGISASAANSSMSNAPPTQRKYRLSGISESIYPSARGDRPDIFRNSHWS
jgi:hypothetical protein